MKQNPVTLSGDGKSFIVPLGGGFSAPSVEYIRSMACELARTLSLPEPTETGLALYEQYRSLIGLYAKSPKSVQTWFDPGTDDEVKRVLERYRMSRKTVRIVYGDAHTGRSWHDEFDVYGIIGRSMGSLRAPLLVAPNASGGPAILTSSIVRILDGATSNEVYRAPTWKTSTFLIQPSTVLDGSSDVLIDGESFATEPSVQKALGYALFIGALRASKNAAHAAARKLCSQGFAGGLVPAAL